MERVCTTPQKLLYKSRPMTHRKRYVGNIHDSFENVAKDDLRSSRRVRVTDDASVSTN